MIIYIVGIVAIILIIYIIAVYNKLTNLNNMVNEAFSTMDIYLKKRWDLVPNLVNVVKGYATHEKGVFERITELRTNSYQNMATIKKLNVNEQLAEDISKMMLVAESYPELKANENFLQLNNELSKIEDEIANSRKYYNGTVRIYNNKVLMFPSSIIASIFRFKKAQMFQADSEEKNSVKVELKKKKKIVMII